MVEWCLFFKKQLTRHSAFRHMFTAEKVWHASEWLWWCGMCVSRGEGSGSTLRVVNLRVGLLIILWVIYATSKSWISYLKHYTTLSYIHVRATCMHWWSSRTLSLVRLSATCPFVSPQRFSVSTDNERHLTKRWIHLGMCVVWIMVRFHIKVRARAYTWVPPTGLKWGGYASWCSAFPVCEACATSKLCIGYSNIT